MNYPESTLYIVGNSKSQQNNPITQLYGQFMMGFLVDSQTGNIIEVESNAILTLTNKFVEDFFVGKNMVSDFESIRSNITKRYLGSSQKAILVALKDAQKKYLDYKSGKPVEL